MSRELLFSITKKDFSIQYFSGTGAGGQHRNKHQNCVRLQHLDSGAVSTGQSSKSRKANLQRAFCTLISSATFKLWQQRKIAEIQTDKTTEGEIKEMMLPKNLLVEYKKDREWVND